MLVAESADEAAGTWEEAYPEFHAIGFHRAPLSLAETILARALLSRVGLALPDGVSTLVKQQEDNSLALSIRSSKLVVDGVALVPWAGRSERNRGCRSHRRPPGGWGCRDELRRNHKRARHNSQEPRDDVRFDGVTCKEIAWGGSGLPNEPATLYGALARAAMIAGAAGRVPVESVQYANDRIQFGRLIGRFQVFQQSLATMARDVIAAQTAGLAACTNAGTHPQPFMVAVAKVRAGKAVDHVSATGHQVHGTIGFTHQHSLHYMTRRLWSWRADFGSDSAWAKRLGRQAIERGAQLLGRPEGAGAVLDLKALLPRFVDRDGVFWSPLCYPLRPVGAFSLPLCVQVAVGKSQPFASPSQPPKKPISSFICLNWTW